MTPVTSLEEAYKAIQDLMNEEKWAEAYKVCLEVLRIDSENLKAIHFKNKIEKNVRRVNKEAIEEDIKKLEPLWEQHQYQEILTNLKQLEPYLKDFPKIKPLILKAKQKYEEQLGQQLENSYQNDLNNINEFLKNKNFHEAFLNAEKLRAMNLHLQDLKKLSAKICSEWIDDEIATNKGLLASEKFQEILFFYQKLLKIDPESARVKKAMEDINKNYRSYRIEEKKEFLYKSLEAMRTLYQLKKYEKACAVCAEILEIDPENKVVQSFQKKSAAKAQKLIDKEVITQMIANRKALQTEYKANPSNFTRI